MSSIYIGSDHNVNYTGASKASDGSYLNDGTCTYALKDSAGTSLGTGTLSYTADSDGNYTGTIESTVTSGLTAGAKYTLEVTFSKSGYNDFRKLILIASYRGVS